jgi:hypothetical protein
MANPTQEVQAMASREQEVLTWAQLQGLPWDRGQLKVADRLQDLAWEKWDRKEFHAAAHLELIAARMWAVSDVEFSEMREIAELGVAQLLAGK